ncbi:MAG TPA: hypothetical protein VKJ01_27955 [Candidatus Solibacter sp.]|nr:hypothetical protein [Candidatus Solibacter sp.]
MIARVFALVLAIAGFLSAVAVQAMPAPVSAPGEQGLLCRHAIQQAEIGSGLPLHMLGAIGRVESGRADPETGQIHPWPWTINAAGEGNFFATKAQAIAFTRQLQARGVQSIDVGCLQVNLMYHPDAFHDLEEAFDPASNARYAVKFLTQLREKSGSWEAASAWYHSANAQEGVPYRAKVVTAMTEEAKGAVSYVALAEAVPMAWSAAASPLRGMLAGRGNIFMLPRATRGAILAQSNGMVAGASGSAVSMPQIAATSAAGRGLDSYRMQPVRVVTSLMAAR